MRIGQTENRLPSVRHGGTMRQDLKLSPEYIKAIEAVLARDERVMLIPTKDRIKVVRVRNEEVKVDSKTDYITKY